MISSVLAKKIRIRKCMSLKQAWFEVCTSISECNFSYIDWSIFLLQIIIPISMSAHILSDLQHRTFIQIIAK